MNPTLLTLARQRGDIDCGGPRYLVVGYGIFDQLVIASSDGHASIAFNHDSDPASYVDKVNAVLDGWSVRDQL